MTYAYQLLQRVYFYNKLEQMPINIWSIQLWTLHFELIKTTQLIKPKLRKEGFIKCITFFRKYKDRFTLRKKFANNLHCN